VPYLPFPGPNRQFNHHVTPGTSRRVETQLGSPVPNAGKYRVPGLLEQLVDAQAALTTGDSTHISVRVAICGEIEIVLIVDISFLSLSDKTR